jgi:hypothetical protein
VSLARIVGEKPTGRFRTFGSTANHNANGWAIGGTAGYNYQLSNSVVLGLEADLSRLNVTERRIVRIPIIAVIQSLSGLEQSGLG